MIERNSIDGKCISFIRISSMLMVLFCHICRMISALHILNILFGSATFTFLIISGVLYGSRHKKYDFKWVGTRAIRILIPVDIWTVILTVIAVMKRGGAQISIIQIIFNLFGLTLFGYEIPGGGHLYFVTVILICYIVTPLMSRVSKPNKIAFVIFALLCVVIQGVGLQYISAMRGLIYINVYMAAYFYAANKDESKLLEISRLKYCALSIFTVLIWIIRFAGYYEGMDNTLLYKNLLSYLSCAVLGIWLFFTIAFIYKRIIYRFVDRFLVLDKYCYEIYIVHFCFTVGPLSVFSLQKLPVAVNVLLAVLFSIAAAYVLNKVNVYLPKKIRQQKS